MKTLNSIRFALLVVAALLTPTAFSAKPPPPPPPPPSSGTLVLDWLYPGGSWAENWGLTVAPSGTIYASGNANDVDPRGIVLASSDSGISWSLMDDFAPPERSVYYWDYGGGIASDAAGNLYVAVTTYDYVNFTEPDLWYVRRSTDGGTTWTTVDEFPSGGIGADGRDVTGITVDAAGDVYVSGRAGSTTWTIRKGVGGISFSTVDVMPNNNRYPTAMFTHPTAGIFAGGSRSIVIHNKTSSAWTVRRSTDGGATWSNVDTFQQLSSGLGAGARGIGADVDGNLYVVGTATTTSQGNTIRHWLVRKGINGGSSWSSVDDFQPSGSNAEARCFAATSNGDLYVAGVIGSYGAYRWIVRKNPGGTGTWTTIDDYQYAPGVSAEPQAMAADASGNLFVGGTGGGHWLIKKY